MTVGMSLARAGIPAGFLQKVQDYPMLLADEELDLARAWHDRRDVAAYHRLVTSHLRLVTKIAMSYRGYGLPVGDMVNEGTIGLMQAVERFDPDRGFRLSTYAMWWIRAAIHEHILHSWSLVKMGTTAAQKKLFFNLHRLKNHIHAADEGDLQPEQVAKIARLLDVPEQDVVTMNRRLSGRDHSLNVPVYEDGGIDWQEELVDEAECHDTSFAEREEFDGRKARLDEVMKVLNERERHILVERRLKENPVKLEVLSQHYGVSRERVRQIEMRAIEKLRKAMNVRSHGRTVPKIPAKAPFPPFPLPDGYAAGTASEAARAFELELA